MNSFCRFLSIVSNLPEEFIERHECVYIARIFNWSVDCVASLSISLCINCLPSQLTIVVKPYCACRSWVSPMKFTRDPKIPTKKRKTKFKTFQCSMYNSAFACNRFEPLSNWKHFNRFSIGKRTIDFAFSALFAAPTNANSNTTFG